MKNSLKTFLDEYNRIVFSRKDLNAFSESIVDRGFSGSHPRKTVIDGKWSLTGDHELNLAVSASDTDHSGKTLVLKADIISASSSGLVFRFRRASPLSGVTTRTLELKGIWSVNSSNRLTFRVAKSGGRYDVLTFYGEWKVSKNNLLSYKLTRTFLKTKIKDDTIFTFRGHWDIFKNRVVYSLEGDGKSFFSFKASLQTKSLMAKKGEIRYQIGAGFASKKDASGVLQGTIVLYGVWKLSRDLKVSFQLNDPSGRKRSILFGIEKIFFENRKIEVSLRDRNGEKLGLDVTFSRVFSNDAEFFVSLGLNASESRILGGLRIRF